MTDGSAWSERALPNVLPRVKDVRLISKQWGLRLRW